MAKKVEPKKYKPVVLVVLDGVGVNVSNPESTWKHAELPTFRELEKFYPFTTIQASGIAVGLPWGEEGNSEVGHFTMGAGKALHHHLPRIIMSIHDGSFFKNPAFLEAAGFVKKSGGKLHLAGLLTSGSVHAYIDHLYALLDFAKQENLGRVFLHIFTDGKDSPTKESFMLIRELEERLAQKYPFAKIATISGRFYAMDRDENWDRIDKVFQCIAGAAGNNFEKASLYIENSYASGVTDEFIEPGKSGAGALEAGDAIIFWNFREDSMREISLAIKKIENVFLVSMTEYSPELQIKVAFHPLDVAWPLARAVSQGELTQLHIAETEKYAHVTYFFNGGKEKPYPGEERMLIPSIHTAHFDETPEMSAEKVVEAVLENISKFDFILANLANGDIVGHTGNFSATVKALEILDASLAKIMDVVLEEGGALIITADHGNAEEKVYSTSGEKRTKHTSNPVPFFLVAKEFKSKKPKSAEDIISRYSRVMGLLTDIAPTVLGLMGLQKPADMTGVDLSEKLK